MMNKLKVKNTLAYIASGITTILVFALLIGAIVLLFLYGNNERKKIIEENHQTVIAEYPVYEYRAVHDHYIVSYYFSHKYNEVCIHKDDVHFNYTENPKIAYLVKYKDNHYELFIDKSTDS